MPILDTCQKLEKYCGTCVKIYNDHTDSNGNFTDSREQQEFEKLNMKIIDLMGTLPAAEAQALPHPVGIESIKALRAQLYTDRITPVTEIILADPNNGSTAQTPSHNTSRVKNRTFEGMFGKPNRSNFKDFADFAGVIRAGFNDPRILNLREGGGSTGGFAVPEELSAFLLDASLADEIIRPRASVFPMKGESIKIPSFDALNHTSSVLGGIVGHWINESADGAITDPSLRLMEMSAKKLAVFSKSSNELLEDSTTFADNLQSGLIRGMGFFMDLAYLTGSGVGEPLGILNSNSLITVAKSASQTSQTLTYNNLSDMFSRLAPSCFSGAIWLANPSTLGQLLKLTPTTATLYPVMNETAGTFRIFGKEVIFTELLPTLGTEGDIILCNLSQYAIALRRDIRIDKSQDIKFLSDESVFRAICRTDGQSLWNTCLTPYKGPTCSWAVTVADRA